MNWLIPPAQLAGHSAAITEVFVLLVTVVILGVIWWLTLGIWREVGTSVVTSPGVRRRRRLGAVVCMVASVIAVALWALILSHHAGCYRAGFVKELAWQHSSPDLPTCPDAKGMAHLTRAYQWAVMRSIAKHLIVGLVTIGSAWAVTKASKPRRSGWAVPAFFGTGLLLGAALALAVLARY